MATCDGGRAFVDRRDTMTAGAGRARPNPTARHATWLRARSGDMVAMSVPHVRATMESRRRHFSSARVQFSSARTVLREAHYGGSKCPFAIEQQPCSDVSCVWKVTEESRFKLTR